MSFLSQYFHLFQYECVDLIENYRFLSISPFIDKNMVQNLILYYFLLFRTYLTNVIIYYIFLQHSVNNKGLKLYIELCIVHGREKTLIISHFFVWDVGTQHVYCLSVILQKKDSPMMLDYYLFGLGSRRNNQLFIYLFIFCFINNLFASPFKFFCFKFTICFLDE